MLNNLTDRGKIILYVVAALVLCIAGYCAYQYFHPAQPATTLSQQQAETTQGISLAAHNAKVGLVQDQLNQASNEIKRLQGLPPNIVIKPVPYEIEKTVTQYIKTSGADFAIVTDPANPTKQVDLKEVAKLPANTEVTLNQYNVFAYKKILKGMDLYPKFDGITPIGLKEISFDYNRKISKDGKYLGIAAGYNFDDKKAKAGLRVMF